MATLLADLDPTYPLAGLLFTLIGTLGTIAWQLWRGKHVEVPATKADGALKNAQAAREEAAAAVQMLEAQQTFIGSVTAQLHEAQRQAQDAQQSAHAAKLAAERGELQLERVKTEAAQREHELVNERLKLIARIGGMERTVEEQATRIVALEAQLGQIERRGA